MGIQERKLREKAERRKSILQKARVLIEQKSYSEITMEDLAKELELSRATLYLYFSNKSEIYITLLTQGMQELRLSYDEWLAENPAELAVNRLMALSKIFFMFYQKDNSYFDLMFSKRKDMLKEVSPETLAANKESGKSIIEPLLMAITEGIEKGEFKRRKPEKVAYMLRAIIIGIAIGFKEGKLNFPEDLPLVEEFILPGIMR